MFDVSLNRRPISTTKQRKKSLDVYLPLEKKIKQSEDKDYNNDLDVELLARPMTMAGDRPVKLNDRSASNKTSEDSEPLLNLPSLQQRPNRS